MAVIGVAVLYATFYVLLGVDSSVSMKVTDCKSFVDSLAIYCFCLLWMFAISLAPAKILFCVTFNNYTS